MKNSQVEQLVKRVLSNEKDLLVDLSKRQKGKRQKGKNVFLGKKVKLEKNVVFDTTHGAIVIDDNTIVKSHTLLEGPLYIGKNCSINSFSRIAISQIGDVCKIGGEVEHSIFEGYSNKQHQGSIGHSYVGKWVNIGGGTSVSNLKNTYSNIKVRGKDTSSIFMGAIIGDYVKIAINSSIFCGKVIGEGAHIYGTVVDDVPPFVSHIRPGVLYKIPLAVASRIQAAMAKRRGLKFGEKANKNFTALYKETAKERKKYKIKKGKPSFK